MLLPGCLVELQPLCCLPCAEACWNKTQQLLLIGSEAARGTYPTLVGLGAAWKANRFTSASMEVCANATAQPLLSSEPEAEPRVWLALDKTSLWVPRDHVMAQLIFPAFSVLALGLFCCTVTHFRVQNITPLLESSVIDTTVSGVLEETPLPLCS